MNRTYLVIAIIAAISSLGLVWTLSQNNNNSTSTNDTSTVAVQSASKDMKLYDVRTPEEYAISRAEGATLLPLANIQRGTYPDVDKDEPIGIYCRSGNRSQEATEILEQAGFTNVTDLGGLQDLPGHNIRVVANR